MGWGGVGWWAREGDWRARGAAAWQQRHCTCTSQSPGPQPTSFPAFNPLPALPFLCVRVLALWPPPPSLQGAGLYQEGAPAPKMSDQDIVEFIFFPVVNEGCRVIDEGALSFTAIGCPRCIVCMASHCQLVLVMDMRVCRAGSVPGAQPAAAPNPAGGATHRCRRHACPLRCPALPPHLPACPLTCLHACLPAPSPACLPACFPPARRPCRHCGQGC